MSVRQAVGGSYQYNHPYYGEQDYFHRDRETGMVHMRTGARGLHVTEDFVVGLQGGLEEEVGDAAGVVMYRAGYEWGLQDMKAFEGRFEREFGGRMKMSEHNIIFALEQWWWPLTAEGWGTWMVDFSQRKQGLIFTDVYDSAVAKSLGNLGKPVCHMYAGLLAGIFTYFSKHELSGIEIQCYAMGEDYCKFLTGSSKKIDSTSFWLQEGASSKEIIERLTA